MQFWYSRFDLSHETFFLLNMLKNHHADVNLHEDYNHIPNYVRNAFYFVLSKGITVENKHGRFYGHYTNAFEHIQGCWFVDNEGKEYLVSQFIAENGCLTYKLSHYEEGMPVNDYIWEKLDEAILAFNLSRKK